MATYRLSGLTIFLILLAVLLVAYLLNFTWESFACGCKKEGFTDSLTDYGEIVQGYSENNKNVVKLYESNGKKLFFDPINRNIIEPLSNSNLRITGRNNNLKEHSYAQNIREVWKHDATGSWTTSDTTQGNSLDITDKTEEELKNYFKDMDGDDQLLSVSISEGIVTSAATYNLSSILGLSDTGTTVMAESETRDLFERQQLPKTGNSNLYWRAYKNDNYNPDEKAGTSTEFIYTGHVENGNSPCVALLHIPIQETSVTFIHVMDLEKNKHVETWYFNGDEIEHKHHPKAINEVDTDFSSINGKNVAFEKKYDDEMSQIAEGDFIVETTHLKNSDSPAVKIVCRKKETIGYSSFRALITFDGDKRPLLGKIETSSGSDSEKSSDDDSDKTEREQKWDQLRELQASLYGPFSGGYPYFGQQSHQYDGSPYSDYLLKTEVVPPVCPTCPTCPKEGVCTNCGGSGGSGSSELKDSLIKEFGSGIDSFLRDGADGATNIARDAATGTYDVAKEATTGTVQLAKDTVSGAGGYAKDAASGAYSAASDVASGTVGIGRDIVGGAYNAGADVVGGAYNAGASVAGGAYNAGASVAGGAYNIGTGAVNALGRLNPTYGTASGGGAQAGGAYGGTAVPNSNMGGYQNSYAGGYQNPQVPATAGQDPYSYFGSIPSRNNMSNVMPVTADFSSFSR